MALADRLRDRARAVRDWFFPPEVPVPEGVRRLVAAVYPTLDLRRVSFHRGVPHLLGLVDSHAMAVPAALSPRRIRIYVRPRYWDTATVEGLGLLLHEAFHALQIQETGPGLGLLRPFTILYLACAGGSRFLYHLHPMEVDAYRVAGRRRSLFEQAFLAQPGSLVPVLVADGPVTPETVPCLPEGGPVIPSSEPSFWGRLAASTPVARGIARRARRFQGIPALLLAAAAWPLIALWLLAWTVVVALLWLARLVVEAAGALAAALLWTLAVLVRPFRRLI
ncbi:MAG TPA: hypothetical protein VEL74_15235 [Thermoanaerobaculia bacterium]|nr:hypothetical protein [Thermoanaerobaculia bacterium]